MSEERWLPVVGYEGLYEVSDQGRVRSLDRTCLMPADGDRHPAPYIRISKGRVLRPGIMSSGYASVALHRDKKQTSHLVHHLVATAFIGPRPEGLIACHGPAGKLDNSLRNLSYGTYAKNNGPDKVRDGTDPIGERNPRSKLREADVREILRCQGVLPQWLLAQLYNVSPWTIRSIHQRRSWAHLHKVDQGNDLVEA